MAVPALAVCAGLVHPAAAQTFGQDPAMNGVVSPPGAQFPNAWGAPVAYGAVPDRTAVDPAFRVGPGDVLLINVLEDPTLDAEVLVRPDGIITVPLAGAVMAAGRTPEEIAAAVREKLRPNFIEPPSVTTALRALAAAGAAQEEELLTVYVLGEVNNPGGFAVKKPVGLLQALSLAGGAGIFAARERIQLRLRNGQGAEQVVLVDYEAIEDGAAAPDILLGDGDTVVVPERGLFE